MDIINDDYSQKYNSLAGGTPASPGIVTLIPSATIAFNRQAIALYNILTNGTRQHSPKHTFSQTIYTD